MPESSPAGSSPILAAASSIDAGNSVGSTGAPALALRVGCANDQLLARFLFSGPARTGLLHADPHPGNFRITADGRLGVLDFGAVNRLPHGLPPEMGRILTAALAGDGDELVAVLRQAGFIRPGIDIDPQGLVEYLEPLVAPMLHEQFTPTRTWLRGAAAKIQDPRRPQFLVGLKLNLPPEYLLIHRVWLGGIGVLSQVGGTVPLREMICAYLPGVDESRLPPDPSASPAE